LHKIGGQTSRMATRIKSRTKLGRPSKPQSVDSIGVAIENRLVEQLAVGRGADGGSNRAWSWRSYRSVLDSRIATPPISM